MTKNNFFRQHPDPFVQIMLNTELTPEKIIPAFSDPSIIFSPKVQAFLHILLADAGIEPFDEANKFAESVYMTPCHVDLQIIFLAAWYGVMIVLQSFPLDQMNAIQATMNGLISKDTLPEIKTIATSVKSVDYFFRSDFITQLKLANQLLENLPHESPYYRKFATLYCMNFLDRGMGIQVSEILKNLAPTDYDQKGITLSKLANSVLTGNLEEAPKLIEQISTHLDHKYCKVYHHSYYMSLSLFNLMNDFDGNSSSILYKNPTDKQSWIHSTQALLNRKPEEALHWARKSADEITSRAGNPLDFTDYTLIRAELAMSNGSGAKRLLLHLRDRGTQTFIDDFYFARAEKLLGNLDAAAAHFAKLRKSIKKYEAVKRLDFEVALAYEMKACDLLELGELSIEISTTELQVPRLQSSKAKGLAAIVSTSSAIEQVKNSILKFADLDFPILITGETGTGKELVARALHDVSKREANRFIAINCSSISDALIESEFFGHTPGAFTGARSAYQGIFREAGEIP